MLPGSIFGEDAHLGRLGEFGGIGVPTLREAGAEVACGFVHLPVQQRFALAPPPPLGGPCRWPEAPGVAADWAIAPTRAGRLPLCPVWAALAVRACVWARRAGAFSCVQAGVTGLWADACARRGKPGVGQRRFGAVVLLVGGRAGRC